MFTTDFLNLHEGEYGTSQMLCRYSLIMKKFILTMLSSALVLACTATVVFASDIPQTGSDPKWKTIVPIVAIVVAVVLIACSFIFKKKQ